MKRFILLISTCCVVFAGHAQSLYVPSGTAGIASSSSNVGVGVPVPIGHFQVNANRPILFRSNGSQGVYGSEIGFNTMLITTQVPNRIKKLGGTLQHGGANIAVDYTGNMRFQMLTAGADTEYEIDYVPQVTFLNSGNVGLGTISPQYKLDVRSGTLHVVNTSANAYTLLARSGDPSTNESYFYHRITTNYHVLGSNENGTGTLRKLGFAMGGGDAEADVKMTIDVNGNVGIGTTSPGALLHTVSATDNRFNMNSNSASSLSGIGLFNDTGSAGLSMVAFGSAYSGASFQRPNGSAIYTTASAGGAAGMAIAAQNPTGYITFHTGGETERLRIAANGKVGIGNATPQKTLDVFSGYNDVISVGSTLGMGQFTGIHFGYLSATHTNYRKSALVFQRIDEHANGKIHLLNGNSGSASATLADARLTIDQNGNVGIGTVNPDELLSVDGTVHAEEVVVDLLVPGPDYVFEQDYELPSLEQIQSYIIANKHLPEVPSAREMEENGIKVGEMNMLLLKKVEELTLYLIQQQAEIEELKKKVEVKNK